MNNRLRDTANRINKALEILDAAPAQPQPLRVDAAQLDLQIQQIIDAYPDGEAEGLETLLSDIAIHLRDTGQVVLVDIEPDRVR